MRLREEAADEIERLRAQVAELERDAGRYRWLVENATISADDWLHNGRDPASTKHPLDNRIDAAIDKAREGA